MILEAFIAQVEAIAQASPVYRLGGDGSDGTCDCIGLVIGAIRRAGGSWTGTHGSNYAARYEMRELLPVTDAGELCLGDVVYKARTPGQAGYALPERYKKGPDQRDYYHVGVVTAVEPLEITHCTGPGIVRDTKLGKWTYRGRLEKVDYDGTEVVETMAQEAKVTAASGSTVKMRSKPSTSDGLYWEVPVGAEVQVAEITGGWAKVRYGDRTGYMMVAFLDMGGQEAPEEGGSAESVAGGGLVTVQRAALQEVYDALGSILQGG
nr:MAG TPA: protein of unknown function (DUF1287) [Caudoviricetes sp.]